MNENVTTGSGGKITENEHVKELFGILQETGKDSSGLSALIDYVSGMEDFVKQSESNLANMKSQLAEMKEIQDHPIKHALQKTITSLETKIAEIKAAIVELKSNIVEGCRSAVAAFKEKGAAAPDKLASFFGIKSCLETIKNNTLKSVDNCDKAMENIQAFSKQYHTAGRAFKNMARMAVGRKPIDTVKESGRLAKVVSAPYKAQKACMNGIGKQVDKMISALDKLEQSVGREKKPTIMERLSDKKEQIKRMELETPKTERAPKKSQGIEA